MTMRSHVAVAVGLSAVACTTGPDRPDTVQYQFYLTALGSDTIAGRIRWYDCLVTGVFQVPNPPPVSETVRFPVRVMRSLSEYDGSHTENTLADSSFSEAVLQYAGLGVDTLTFTFGAGDYTVTPEAGVQSAGYGASEYSGAWSCGLDVPLAQDSTLTAYGYPQVEIPGNWRIGEILLLD
jgi:hypothetical protein